MSTTLTLLRMSCPLACRHCAYGVQRPVPLDAVLALVDEVEAAGYDAHFYDMRVTAESLAVFRRTRQFERPNPGWLNVTADFVPSPEDCAYVDTLDTALVMSLHGSTPELHALLSGRVHDHARIVEALHQLRRTVKLPLGINCVVHRHNVGDLATLIAWARTSLPVDFVELISLGYGGSSTQQLDPSFALDGAATSEAYATMRRLKRRWPDFVQLDAQWGPDFGDIAQHACHLFAEPVPDRFCNAGVNHWALRVDTREVFACPTFAEVHEARVGRWEDGKLVLERDWQAETHAQLGEPCASCAERSRCGGACRSIAYCDATLPGRPRVDRPLAAGFERCLVQLRA